MPFFRKKIIIHNPTFEDDMSALEVKIQSEVSQAEDRLEKIRVENHKKKSLQAMPHAIELLLNGLASGKLKKEEI